MKASQELFYKNVNSEKDAQIIEEYLNNSNSKIQSLCKDAAENSRPTTETGNEPDLSPGPWVLSSHKPEVSFPSFLSSQTFINRNIVFSVALLPFWNVFWPSEPL